MKKEQIVVLIQQGQIDMEQGCKMRKSVYPPNDNWNCGRKSQFPWQLVCSVNTWATAQCCVRVLAKCAFWLIEYQ